MSLIYNGTTITDVTYNGTSLTTLIFNGTTVWQKIVTPSTIDVLVVAGGGSSGTQQPYDDCFGGGGGAGGMCEQSGRAISAGTTYTVTVGAGGASRPPKEWYVDKGLPGSNSIFDTITSLGGGAGGGSSLDIYPREADGGSGGGAPTYYGEARNQGGAATQGNSGGATGYGTNGAGYPGGGYTYGGAPGGGAGGLGTGRANSITGSSVTYAKGGGFDGLAGQANTGNGGAIQHNYIGEGITGGSGVVVVRYPNTYSTATVTGSPTYTNTGGYHVYKFTGSGTIRW